MANASFGSSRGFSETLISATPLILTGVAAAVAFKMLVWNIGAEGQFLMGAVFAAGAAIALGPGTPMADRPPAGHHRRCASAEPSGPRSRQFPRSTWVPTRSSPRLMLNFIALNFMNYLIFGSNSPWRDPEVSQFPTGRPLPDSSRIPEFFNRLDYGIHHCGVLLAVLAWFLISKTKWGFEVRIVGDSADTARYAGIAVPRKFLGVFLMSGAFAGLAGFAVRRRTRRCTRPSVARSWSWLHRHHRGGSGPAQPHRRRPGWAS